MVDWGRG